MFRNSVFDKCNFGLRCTRRLFPHRHDETNTGKDVDMMTRIMMKIGKLWEGEGAGGQSLGGM